MKFDIQGRINNMRLPDGKTAILYSVYEAVSNAIHAINDRVGEENAAKKGRIDVSIELDDDNDIQTISVTDNGIGFTEENIASFETSDSRFKYKRGGKGVGRFIWIKLFDTIRVDSVRQQGRKRERVTFRFAPQKANSIAYKRLTDAGKRDLGSTITLTDLKSDQKSGIRASSYLKDLALHFFPQFVAGTLPQIYVDYDGDVKNLNEYIDLLVEPAVTTEAKVKIDGRDELIVVSHMFVDSKISSGLRNSYLRTAHGRLVGDPISIERKYALKELPDGKSYAAVVSSTFLDERVDQERLDFKLTTQQKDSLEAAILASTEAFLGSHISAQRERQKATVKTLVAEHPQLASQFESIEDYVAGLSPGMDEEQIAQNLFVLLYRDERDIRERIVGLEELDAFSSIDSGLRSEAEKILKELDTQEKNRLAELVVKRHQILQVANLMIGYDDADKENYQYEKVVHDLICPLGKIYRTGHVDDHNLWILDESLASYQFFASDKTIGSIAPDSKSSKEPDIVFFNPLGFRREDTAEPVAIVEFKRPGDARASQDPVAQVLGYIDELKGNKVRDVDGKVVSDITADTPFHCVIVCELTEATKRMLERSIAQNKMPDGEGYYGWSKPHNAYIKVISFQKMIRDAERRNQAYFDTLKLPRPSAAAKKRAAVRREKAREAAIVTVSAEDDV